MINEINEVERRHKKKGEKEQARSVGSADGLTGIGVGAI
jgi:hypothetical protein